MKHLEKLISESNATKNCKYSILMSKNSPLKARDLIEKLEIFSTLLV
jgi:hypothetical protein